MQLEVQVAAGECPPRQPGEGQYGSADHRCAQTGQCGHGQLADPATPMRRAGSEELPQAPEDALAPPATERVDRQGGRFRGVVRRAGQE